MKWTAEQDQYLRVNAHKGVAEVQKGMEEDLGIKRNLKAVERHGLRIGVSFKKWEICPACGRKVPRLMKSTGVCEVCHWSVLAEQKKAQRLQLERDQLRQARSNYDREQKAYRRYVDYLNMSANMSEALVG